MTMAEKILAGLKHFRHMGHEVVVFQILDPREVDLGFEDWLLPTGARQVVVVVAEKPAAGGSLEA